MTATAVTALEPRRAAAPAAAFAPDTQDALASLVRRGRARLVTAALVVGAAFAVGGAVAAFDLVAGAIAGALLAGVVAVAAGRAAARALGLAARVRRLDPWRDVAVVAPDGAIAFFDADGAYVDDTLIPYDDGARRYVLAVKERLGAVTLRAERDGARSEQDDLVVRVPPTWTDDDTVRVAAKLAAAANRAAR